MARPKSPPTTSAVPVNLTFADIALLREVSARRGLSANAYMIACIKLGLAVFSSDPGAIENYLPARYQKRPPTP